MAVGLLLDFCLRSRAFACCHRRLPSARLQLEQLQRKMALPGYQDKTPEEIKSADLERIVKMEAELENIRHHIVDMTALLEAAAA